MDDTELFKAALKAAGLSKGELAKRCGVTRQSITAWRKGHLSDRARILLESVIEDSKAA